jgi:uncharacterized NAD-dependent epimerase/dehydratase family protein
MKVALLAHEQFPDDAKTAVGVLRYSDYDVTAVLDRTNDGTRVSDHVPDVQDAPVVASMSDVEDDVDALIIGIAPIGGGFEESWRPDVRNALERGCDVYSGLHYFLAEDEEFRGMADEHDAELWDVRKPPADIGVSEGVADSVDATVVLTVGTDCNVGKMTASRELYEEAREQGLDAAFVATGQTGILIEGSGIPVDRVVSDFTAGAVEDMVLDAGANHDYVFVEGQGSLVHPAYSGVTASIVHGAMPDYFVLCHEHGRDSVHGYDQQLPPVESFVERYESYAEPVSDSEVVAGMLNTQYVETETEARGAVADFEDAIGVPATDPVRFDLEEVVEVLR